MAKKQSRRTSDAQINAQAKKGRPSKLPGIDLDRLMRLAAAGLTMEQLAVALDVAPSSLYLYQAENYAFSEALKQGKAISDDRVERALFERAIGYSHPDTHFSAFEGCVTQTPTVKHYPPDTAAAFIWLKNRRPDSWKDRAAPSDGDNPEAPKTSVSITFVDAVPPPKEKG